MNKEWLMVTLFAVFITLLTALPLIMGYLTQGPEVFMGIPVHVTDANAHLNLIEQAREGELLFTNMFTGETVPALLFNPFHLVLGTIASSSLAVYNVAAILLTFVFFFVLYWFIGEFINDKKTKQVAFFLTGLSTGFGAGWILVQSITGRMLGSSDLWVSEMNTFTMFGQPHFTLATIFMMIVIAFTKRALEHSSNKYAVFAGITALLLTTVHIFDIVTLSAILGTWFVYRQIKYGWEWDEVKKLGIIAFIALPAVAYYAWLFLLNPTYSEWNALNQTITPNIIEIISGYGLIIFLAAFIIYKDRFKDKRTVLLSLWAIANLLLIYLPVNVQRRFIMGLHLPLCMLAAIAIISLTNKLRWQQAIIIGVILITSITTIFLTVDRINNLHDDEVNDYKNVKYLSTEEVEALEWLRELKDRDKIIFAPRKISNYIPSFAYKRIYSGHWAQTINYESKQDYVNEAYATKTFPDIDVNYVWWTDEAVDETVAFKNEEVIIYEVSS